MLTNTIDIYNNTFCNQTCVEKSLLYSCSCYHSNMCLNYYFNTTGIHKICNTNKTNYNRCIVCNNNTSIHFDIKTDDGVCNNDYIGFGFIYRYYLYSIQ